MEGCGYAIIASMRGRLMAAILVLIGADLAIAGSPETASSARQHAEAGVQYASQGDLMNAETELRRAVELAPNDASYLTSLGGILGMQNKLSEANVYLAKAVAADPSNTAARRNLAANEWRLGKFKEAQSNLERLLRVHPDDKVSMLLLGMVSENQHEYTRAQKLLSTVPDLVQQRPESVAALASACYHTGRRDEAHQALEGLLGRSAAAEGIYAAANVAAQAEDWNVAQRLFESIRASYPDRAALTYNLALVQFRSGHAAECRKTLLELTNGGTPNAEMYRLLSRCYEKENSWEEAIHALESAIRVKPEDEANYSDLASLLMRSGRFGAALKVANRTVELFPTSATAYVTKGRVEMRLDQFTDAVRSYTRGVELDPKSVDARVGAASAKWSAGMRPEAEAQFQTLLKQNPGNASVYTSYGTVLLNDDAADSALARARALLEKAVQLDGSSNPEPYFELGILELKTNGSGKSGNPAQEACRQLETAARLGLNDSKLHFALARAYRRLGRENDAAKELQLYQKAKAIEDAAGTPALASASEGK